MPQADVPNRKLLWWHKVLLGLAETVGGAFLTLFFGPVFYFAGVALLTCTGYKGVTPGWEGFCIMIFAGLAGLASGVIVCDMILFRLDWRMIIGCITGGALLVSVFLAAVRYIDLNLLPHNMRLPVICVLLAFAFYVGYQLVFLFGKPRQFRWFNVARTSCP